ADRARPARPSGRGGQRALLVEGAVVAALRQLGQSEGATPFMTLLAAFQALLYRYTGQRDISVGTPIANRAQAEVQELIGFFVNTLVLREEVRGEEGFRSLLRRVREGCVEAYAHQDVPFERLVEEVQPERDQSRSPLFQIMFDLDTSSSKPIELPGVTLTQRWGNSKTSKVDLLLTTKVLEGNLLLHCEYSSDLFEPETVERMLRHFEIFLRGIIARPDRPIDELPLLTEEERRQLVDERGEVERHLIEHPAVYDAVLLRRDAAAGGDTAFVVLNSGFRLAPEKLQDYLLKRLPGASSQPAIVLTKMIPASPVEKINFRALRRLVEPEVEAVPASSDSAETHEERLVELSARRAKLSAGKLGLLEKRLQLLQQQRNYERV
ncbi:MAG TPA: condensation domain-containing protein, partial [Pyrinomonadaceae bacterium]